MTQTDQQNVPKLRFPGFEGDWKAEKLGAHVTLFSGASPSKFDLEDIGQVPFIKVEDLNNCVKYQEKSRTYTSHQRGAAPANSVIFPKRGAAILNNKVRIAAVPVQMDSNLMAVATNEETLNSEFLYYEVVRVELHRIADTSTIPQLNNKHINPFVTHLPTLPEQRKIAGFIGAVDTKIVQLAKKKRLLEDYKKGCMQQLFSQKIRFKGDTGSNFPNWEEKRLGGIVSIKKGQQLNRDDMIEGAEYPVINGGISASGYTDMFNTKGGVITVSEGGNSCGYVDWQPHDFWLGGHCYALPLKDSVSHAGYLLQFLKNAQSSIMALRVGSGLPNIQKRDLEKLPVALPHPDEQRKIADFLSSLDRKIDLVGQELNHARSFKQGLLQQMFV